MSEDKNQQRRPSGHTNDSSISRESPVENDNDNAPQNFYDEDEEARRRKEFKENGTKLRRASTRMTENEQAQLAQMLSSVSKEDTSPLLKMGGGRDYPPLLPDRDPYRVDFEGDDDPLFPQNWPLLKKLIISVVLGYITFSISWGSSVFAPAVPFVELEFHMGLVPTILGISLYVLGFASGPILWAPLSELYGRKFPIIVSSLGFMLFTFAVATAKDFQTVLICRFFAGFFGAAPLAVVAAAFADMFDNVTRGFAIALFVGAVSVGPLIAPVIGGFIANSKLHWRWTQYITGIMGALALFFAVFVYEETYHPIILCRKAVELRRRTGNWGIYAPHELIDLDIDELVTKNLTRPVVMLFTETILFLVSMYTAFIYGMLYLLLEAYPIIFGEGFGMKGGVIELPYLGLVIGMLLGITSILVFFEPRYIRKVKQNNGKPVPEERLLVTVAGSIALPIGIFWLCWTGNYPQHVHWIVPTISGLFTGYGILAIFLSTISYIIDTYLLFAASALAANTLLRSGFGAGFPLFATAMFHNLGINFAGTVLGSIAAALIPVPILFIIFGKRIRQRSKYAFDLG